MVFINEWLPNPTGADAKGEFIELFNKGSASANLNGWSLITSGKKIFSLNGYSIGPDDYLLLQRTTTKLALKNADESLSLYNAAGQLVDHSNFEGTAQEGKSLSRINYRTDPSEHFAWNDPTPGTANKIAVSTQVAATQYPLNVALNPASVNSAAFLGMMLAVGAIFATIVIYFVKYDEKAKELILGADKKNWD